MGGVGGVCGCVFFVKRYVGMNFLVFCIECVV